MTTFHCGVIEGFYGRQWTWAQRLQLPDLLPRWGYDSYIYAPKGDSSLRSQWQQPFTAGHRQQLVALAKAFHSANLRWGLGLSPVGLQAEVTDTQLRLLDNKVSAIAQLKPDFLWVLFDDLPAGNPHLATNQLRVINAIAQQLPEVRLAVCPSYYSFDPILESLFGRCPDDYFTTLNAGLAATVDILWTGNQVISDRISAGDIAAATAKLGRKPLLWDNYCANDGKKTSHFLRLAPFSGRPASLQHRCTAHFVNPMNQFALSGLVLPTLPANYRLGPDCQAEDAMARSLALLPTGLASLLKRDWRCFHELGLDGLCEADKQACLAQYGSISHPVAEEVCEWLREGYQFDPNCLTE